MSRDKIEYHNDPKNSRQAIIKTGEEEVVSIRWWIERPLSHDCLDFHVCRYTIKKDYYSTVVRHPFDIPWYTKTEHLNNLGRWEVVPEGTMFEPTMRVPRVLLVAIQQELKVDTKDTEDLIFKLFAKWMKLFKQGELEDVMDTLGALGGPND